MDAKEIYKKLAEIERNKERHSFFLDLFIFICLIMFVGWSITKDIAQETEHQKLNGAIIHQHIVIEELRERNQELGNALQKLLDATDPKKTRSDA